MEKHSKVMGGSRNNAINSRFGNAKADLPICASLLYCDQVWMIDSALIDTSEVLILLVKGMIVIEFSRKIVCGLFLILAVLVISGCATKQLRNNIKNDESGRELYNNDVITAATVTESGTGSYSWVFIGDNFDYALTSGGGDFLHALVTGAMDKTRIRVSENGAFTLNKEKNQFSGEITLKYSYRDQSEKSLILKTLKLTEWYCTGSNKGTGECEIRLYGLKGTIHQKAHVPADVFQFNHPIKINFYTNNTLSAKRLLYPAAVATDVVLSPLYLLGGVAVLTLYGVILLH